FVVFAFGFSKTRFASGAGFPSSMSRIRRMHKAFLGLCEQPAIGNQARIQKKLPVIDGKGLKQGPIE
ncbi:MAG: hypothetical protein LBF40_08115, partial [Deltaproteobacteria bacterium]|nr:hypothetical protein [Deltaproteobacteria bacterium]